MTIRSSFLHRFCWPPAQPTTARASPRLRRRASLFGRSTSPSPATSRRSATFARSPSADRRVDVRATSTDVTVTLQARALAGRRRRRSRRARRKLASSRRLHLRSASGRRDPRVGASRRQLHARLRLARHRHPRAGARHQRQHRRAASVYLGLPLFADASCRSCSRATSTPTARPSRAIQSTPESCSTRSATSSPIRPPAFVRSASRAHRPDARVPRNIAVGGSKVADVLTGGGSYVALLENLVEDPNVQGGDALSQARPVADRSVGEARSRRRLHHRSNGQRHGHGGHPAGQSLPRDRRRRWRRCRRGCRR